MMCPAVTRSPPKRFTPRRWELESRPLRVEPAPFLDANSWRSNWNIAGGVYQGGRAIGKDPNRAKLDLTGGGIVAPEGTLPGTCLPVSPHMWTTLWRRLALMVF